MSVSIFVPIMAKHVKKYKFLKMFSEKLKLDMKEDVKDLPNPLFLLHVSM